MKALIELIIQVLIMICISLIIIYLVLLYNCKEKYQLNDPSRYRMCPINYAVKTSLSQKGEFNICLKNKQNCMPEEQWNSPRDISPEQLNGCYINSPCVCAKPRNWEKIEIGKYICK